MWRLLPLILLASCTANEPRDTATEVRPTGYRIVSIVDVPLNPASRPGGEQVPTRKFQRGDTLVPPLRNLDDNLVCVAGGVL